MTNQEISEKIMEYIRSHYQAPVDAEMLISELGIKSRDIKGFWSALEELEKSGTLIRTRYQKYGIPEAMGLITGRMQITTKGYGFVVPLEKSSGREDLFVPSSALLGAMNDDTVIARVSGKNERGQEEGRVIRILKRAHETLVGTFVVSGDFAFVEPDNQRIHQDIYVRRRDFNHAKNNQKVVVKITSWPDEYHHAEGKITEVLGNPGDIGLEIVSIIKDNDLPLDFPPEVKKAADDVPQKIKAKELAGRKDRRDWSIITIDGVDSKDLDDAVYVEKQGENYFLGVYIADVSYYVRPNSVIDREAYARGTSVYLVDRVLPMLPFTLSNGICSLNEGEDRLAMSCEMLISGKTGKVLSYEIAPTVIRSAHRMNYPDVRKIIEDNDEALCEKYSDIVPMLHTMADLCRVLKKKRIRRGSIDFEIPEVKVILDEQNKPIDIHLRERSIAEMMIEEFMLAANETVAQHMSKRHFPFVYRVHDVPDSDRISALAGLMANFGVILKIGDKIQPKDLQAALDKFKGRPEEGMISTLTLRSMKQAVYQTENIGHFGLAAKDYTHFTSPIRRYPDLMVHRLLKMEASHKKMSAEAAQNLDAKLSLAASHSSTRERAAIEAERQTTDLKMAEYMTQFVGQEFEGTISGVTGFGVFVQLENGVEGLVHISSLNDDYYSYDEAQFAIIGQYSGKRYRLGDPMKIEVLKVDVPERKIDFAPAGFSSKLENQIATQMTQGTSGRHGSSGKKKNSKKKHHQKEEKRDSYRNKSSKRSLSKNGKKRGEGRRRK
jgi:ribonuclease R